MGPVSKMRLILLVLTIRMPFKGQDPKCNLCFSEDRNEVSSMATWAQMDRNAATEMVMF